MLSPMQAHLHSRMLAFEKIICLQLRMRRRMPITIANAAVDAGQFADENLDV